MADPVGPVIGGRYELLDEIGRGGTSTVHRARDVRENRWVAVKVVPIDGTAEAHRRWRREAEVVSSLRHPSLVTVLDQDVDDHAAVLVMELLPDGSLRDRLRLGPLDPAAAAAVGADVAAALAHIHEHGVVHRDVKPANVLLQLCADGRVRGKLTDFGIAKLLESATTSTTTSTVIGTALYLSPEQAQGRAVGTASDVYSLGLTLLEALSGRPAFPGTIAESLTARLLRDPVVPAGFGYGWRSLISAMTARDPQQRPSAREAADRLREIVAHDVVADTVELRAVGDATRPLPVDVEPLPVAPLGIAPLPVSPLPRTRPRRRVRLGLAAAAVTVGLAASGSVLAATPAFAPVAGQDAAAAVTAERPSASPSPTATPSSSATPAASSAVIATAATRSAASSRRTASRTDAGSTRSSQSTPSAPAAPSAPASGGRGLGARPAPKAAGPGRQHAAPPSAKQGRGPGEHRGHGPAAPKSEPGPGRR